MFRYGLAAALTVSGVGFVHSQHLLDRSGLLGSCIALTAAAPDNGRWVECRPGVLTGYPDLSRDACEQGGMRGEMRYWICPTPVVDARASKEAATR